MSTQAPTFWFVHTCGRCGVKVRRHRQHTNAAWYKRNRLEPKAWPITWVDRGGQQDCMSIAAMTERREMGMPRANHGPDARHFADTDLRSDAERTPS
jgi:hypothetical protein